MPKTNRDKELDKMYRDLLETRDSMRSANKSDGNRLLTFFIGLLMLGGGLFMIFQNISVSSSWGYGGHFFSIGGFHLSNGLIMLPIIVGIGMLFLMDKKIFGWIVLSIGIVIVLLSVMLTTHLSWRTTSAYVFIIMFGMTAAGGALVLKELFRKD
ncbi:MAG: hypothetical protein K6G33_10060 [Ruminococcus sp.]|uniref:hypothetical protein n=1 Tax=Ruminococcus sp. TaxID=41978 RepID=UPI00156A17B1|nr:hypothetical protein [Ruminococcus sp.]MCR5601068.1 hypothetical protein [Ruminococcus sp.]